MKFPTSKQHPAATDRIIAAKKKLRKQGGLTPEFLNRFALLIFDPLTLADFMQMWDHKESSSDVLQDWIKLFKEHYSVRLTFSRQAKIAIMKKAQQDGGNMRAIDLFLTMHLSYLFHDVSVVQFNALLGADRTLEVTKKLLEAIDKSIENQNPLEDGYADPDPDAPLDETDLHEDLQDESDNEQADEAGNSDRDPPVGHSLPQRERVHHPTGPLPMLPPRHAEALGSGGR